MEILTVMKGIALRSDVQGLAEIMASLPTEIADNLRFALDTNPGNFFQMMQYHTGKAYVSCADPERLVCVTLPNLLEPQIEELATLMGAVTAEAETEGNVLDAYQSIITAYNTVIGGTLKDVTLEIN